MMLKQIQYIFILLLLLDSHMHTIRKPNKQAN